MNCKPGDLAVVVKGPHAGLLLDVLHLAPDVHRFFLPDGYPSQGGSAAWVCEVAGSPLEMLTESGRTRMARFLVAPDYGLRPVRDPGDDAKDELLRPLPHEVCA